MHFFRAVVAAGLGPGEREKRQREGNAGKEKERRESRPFPLPIVPRAPYIIQKFPIGSLCGGESPRAPRDKVTVQRMKDESCKSKSQLF